jgi:predicted MPP superfamily phosphohydrolase
VRLAARSASALGGRALYRRRWLRPGRFLVREERVRVPGLPSGLDGFTIVQLSDVHAGPFLGPGDLAAVVDRANELAPDLIAFTGDLITDRSSEGLAVLPDLGRLRASRGVFGVFGNHDYKGRREGELAAAAAALGIRFLRNECLRIDTGAGVLALVGVEDIEEARELDLEAARRDVRAGDVEVVLCHNPAGAPALARAGCVAILSGHTHGGQVAFVPTFGPPHVGLRLGLGPTTLIVSRGLGVIGLPLRIGAPSELVRVRLEAGAGG